MRSALILAILMPSTLLACWDNNPCSPGQIVVYTQCAWAPETGAQDATDTATDAAPSTDPWGVACTPTAITDAESGADANDAESQDEAGDADEAESEAQSALDSGPPPTCFGKAPICAPTINYCTNINCAAGEANAGICPTTDGWTCYPASNGNPSACVKL